MTRIPVAVLASFASLGLLTGCICYPYPRGGGCMECAPSCGCTPCSGGPVLDDPGRFQPIPPVPPVVGPPPIGVQAPQAPLPPLQRLVPDAQATPLPAGPTARTR